MLNAMQRLGFMSSATFEHKKLAVEMAEVIIKWELQRIRYENNADKVNFYKNYNIYKIIY